MARESRWTVELLFSIIGIQTGVKSVPTSKETIFQGIVESITIRYPWIQGPNRFVKNHHRAIHYAPGVKQTISACNPVAYMRTFLPNKA
jgi:hypothetical protein